MYAKDLLLQLHLPEQSFFSLGTCLHQAFKHDGIQVCHLQPDAGTATTSFMTYANRANLPEWIEQVLDESWCITYGHVVEPQTDADGVLDMVANKQAARRRLARIIDSTDWLIEFVWTRRNLSASGDDSVRYADDGGCVIDIAGQTVREIRSHTAGAYYSQERTTPHHAIFERGPLVSLTSDNHNPCLRNSVDPQFSIWFEFDRSVAAADAIVIRSRSDWAVSHENCVVGGGIRVQFTFAIVKERRHVEVHANFADSETMMPRTQIFKVDLAYTRKQTDKMGSILSWPTLRKQQVEQVDTMNSTAFLIRTARTRGEVSHFCGYSILYTDDVPAERIVVVAGQTVVMWKGR
ncbi:hypothetical protein IW262DRAFT_1299370 [Armillaria fumosa]|nr:hypothetical protein IW262DRAFT_1299370 [Armillaria fumosa]